MDKYINWKKVFQISLMAGIVFLAYNQKDGWGWLILILALTE